MAGKWKKRLKKIGKVAAIAGAAALAAKLGTKRKRASMASMDDAARGVSHFGKWGPGVGGIQHIPKKRKWDLGPDTGPITIAAKGGRIGAKHGGRTRKQFGGGLNRPVARPVGGVGSTARRDMRSGYYPSDMGMRGGPMYKKGGRVKSRGVAKRGGGAEIK